MLQELNIIPLAITFVLSRTNFTTRSHIPLQHQRLLDRQQHQQEQERRLYEQHLMSVRRQNESDALRMQLGAVGPVPISSAVTGNLPVAGQASQAGAVIDWTRQSHLINHHFR